jgi:hypothetical protein
MAKSSYISKVVRSGLRDRVRKLVAINRASKIIPTDSTSKLLSVVKIKKGTAEAKLMQQKIDYLIKEKKLPTPKEVEKQDLEQRMKTLMDEGKKLKLFISQIKDQLTQYKKGD